MNIKRTFLHSTTAIVLLSAAAGASDTNTNNLPSKPLETSPSRFENQESKMPEDDRLFDNTTMDRVLKKAERLYEQSDMVAAKKEWTRVIDFMHKPRWFPTAAMVPVSLRFAKLADICMKNKQFDDAHELMHAAFEFPFHLAKDEVEIDEIAGRLVGIDKKNGNLEKCKSFLQYAIEKSLEPRRSKYKELLDSLS